MSDYRPIRPAIRQTLLLFLLIQVAHRTISSYCFLAFHVNCSRTLTFAITFFSSITDRCGCLPFVLAPPLRFRFGFHQQSGTRSIDHECRIEVQENNMLFIILPFSDCRLFWFLELVIYKSSISSLTCFGVGLRPFLWVKFSLCLSVG